MISKWAGLGLGVSLFTIVWLGCGGSESGSPGNTTPADGGKESSSPADTGASDSGGGGKKDVAFDGNIDAPEVTLTFGTCPTFTPCGGDEKGSWKVTGGCLSDAVLADAKNQCPGFTTSDEVIKAKGIFELDGTNVTRQVQVKISAKAHIPGACTMGNDCSLVALGAQAQLGFDKVTCTAQAADAGNGCDCDISKTQQQVTSDTYTKDGNTITTGSGDTYDYCVAGSKLTYQDTTGQDPYPLFIELGK